MKRKVKPICVKCKKTILNALRQSQKYHRNCSKIHWAEVGREKSKEYAKSERGKLIKKTWRDNNKDRLNAANRRSRKRKNELKKKMLEEE